MVRHLSENTEMIMMKEEVQGHTGKHQGWSGGRRGSGESLA